MQLRWVHSAIGVHSAIVQLGWVGRDSGFASVSLFGVIACLVGGWHLQIRFLFVLSDKYKYNYCLSYQTNTNTITNTVFSVIALVGGT